MEIPESISACCLVTILRDYAILCFLCFSYINAPTLIISVDASRLCDISVFIIMRHIIFHNLCMFQHSNPCMAFACISQSYDVSHWHLPPLVTFSSLLLHPLVLVACLQNNLFAVWSLQFNFVKMLSVCPPKVFIRSGQGIISSRACQYRAQA